MEGLLNKKNPSFRGGYNKRFVRIFEGRYFCYFDPNSMKAPKGTIDLSTVKEIEELPNSEYKFDEKVGSHFQVSQVRAVLIYSELRLSKKEINGLAPYVKS